MARRTDVAVVAGWVLVLGWIAAWAWASHEPSGISWHFFAQGSHDLLHGAGLHVYARTPTLQIGPLSLVVAGFLERTGQGLVCAQVIGTLLLPACLALLTALTADDEESPVLARHLRVWLVGVVVAPAWAVLAVRWAHLDDVLALTALLALVAVVRREGPAPLAGVLAAAACLAKPWAVVGLPLLLLLPSARGRRRGLVFAAALTAAGWAPFLLTDAGTLAALSPDVAVSDDSVLRLLGVHASVVPAWVRPAQLVAAPGLALVAVLCGRWRGALVAGLAVRMLLDPQDIAYYAAGLVVAAAVWDLAGRRSWRRRLVPWWAAVTALAWWQPFVADYARRERTTGVSHWFFTHPSQVAAVHLGWLVVTLVLVAVGRSPRRQDPVVDRWR